MLGKRRILYRDWGIDRVRFNSRRGSSDAPRLEHEVPPPRLSHRGEVGVRVAMARVEDRLVRRETKTVRSEDIVGHDGDPAARAIDAVDGLRDLGFGLVALVVTEDAEGLWDEKDKEKIF